MSHQLHRWEEIGGSRTPCLVSSGLSQRPRLSCEPDALPFLACVGPSMRLSLARHPSPESVLNPLTQESLAQWGFMDHCGIWRITAPLTLRVWLPLDSQVPAVPTGFSETTGHFLGHTTTFQSVSSVLSAPGVRYKSTSRFLLGAALGSSLSTTFPDMGLLASSFDLPNFSVPAPGASLSRPPSRPLGARVGSRHPARGTRPRVPGECPPQCPGPTPSQAARGGRTVPGAARRRGGNYRKCREKPWSFPIWSRRRRRRRGRCRQVAVAEPAS